MPVTARAALRALENDLLPPEAFVFLGTSVRPLDEEPVSLEEIERILAREDLDLQVNLLLMRVLRRLLGSADPEVALFAAESINRIESRYTDRIESLKRRGPRPDTARPEAAQDTAPDQDPQALRGLASAYYHLAQIYPATIRSFYLREAFGCIKQLRTRKALRREDVSLLVRILLDLRLPGQALGVLKRVRYGTDPGFLLLEAEVEFQRRNLPRVGEICRQLAGQRHRLGAEALRVLELWEEA